MKAIVLRTAGGPEVLRLEDVPDPVPGPGEVLVRVEAIGVNFRETQVRAGLIEILARVADGRTTPLIDQELPLADAARAHELIDARAALGKLVLIP